MRILTFATQKGGSGKSTLASSLAVAVEAEGLRVVILDTDPQRTVGKWGKRREATSPVVEACEPHQLQARLKELAAAGFDLAIIDTPGKQGVDLAPAFQVSDFCVLPVRPNVADLAAVIETAQQLRDRKEPFAFVLNGCFGSTGRMTDATASLLKFGEVMPANIYQRADFPDADASGLGVTEFNPSGKAAKEVALLWAWLQHRAKGDRAA